MNYVLNGKTINFGETYDNVFFEKLKDALHFPCEILRKSMHKKIIKDIITEDKIGSQEIFDALLLQDYDIQCYIWSLLDSLLSVTDVPDIIYGATNDSYRINDDYYRGDEYSFAELAYENNWAIVSFSDVAAEEIFTEITKNDVDSKTINVASELKQVYLIEAISEGAFLGRFFTSFDRVFCVRNCNFNDWDSIPKSGKQKVLITYYKEIEHVIHNEFDKLGHFHGRNTSRVLKINDNLFEYRVSNPNYRIYYTRANDNIVILLTLLKDRSDISTNTMNNLMRMKNCEYEKAVS